MATTAKQGTVMSKIKEYIFPDYDAPGDKKFIGGVESTDPKAKPYQDLPFMKLIAASIQHVLAVVFGICMPVILLGVAGSCACVDQDESRESCTAGLTNDNMQQYIDDGKIQGACFIKTDADNNYLVNIAVIMCGFATMMQSSRHFMIGAQILSIMGCSFAFLSIMIQTGFRGGPDRGVGTILGMSMATCFAEPLMMYLLPKPALRTLQHPTILGVVVFLIGSELTASAIQDFGGRPSAGGGSRLHFSLGFASLMVLVLLQRFGTPMIKNMAILLTIISGYIIAIIVHVSVTEYEGRFNGYGQACADYFATDPENLGKPAGWYMFSSLKEKWGRYEFKDGSTKRGTFGYFPACAPIVDFRPMNLPLTRVEQWLCWPFQRTFGFYFDPSMVLGWLMATLVSTLETMGDVTATANLSAKKCKGPHFMHRIRGALWGDAMGSFFSALTGALPNTTFSQNNGIIALTGIHDRRAGIIAGGILLLLGFIAPFGGFLRTIPTPVFGGLTVVLFSQVAVSGLRMLTEPTAHAHKAWLEGKTTHVHSPLDNPRNQFITAVSIGLGLGTNINKNGDNVTTLGYASTVQLPDQIIEFILLDTGLLMGSLSAIILNILIPEHKTITKEEEEKKKKEKEKLKDLTFVEKVKHFSLFIVTCKWCGDDEEDDDEEFDLRYSDKNVEMDYADGPAVAAVRTTRESVNDSLGPRRSTEHAPKHVDDMELGKEESPEAVPLKAVE